MASSSSTPQASNANMPSYEELPDGWVRQFDQSSKHPFWVDTKVDPPRAIWVHPYEDEQFLDEHPEVRDRLTKSSERLSPEELPPPYSPRRHSDSDMHRPSSSRPAAGGSSSRTQSQKGKGRERGFFGKLKDKAIGTKEEREEARRQEALYMQMREKERQRAFQEMQRQQEQYLRQQRNARPSGYPGSSSYYYGQPTQGGQAYYAAPSGSPYGYTGYESYDRYGRRRGGRGYGGGGFGGGGFGGAGLPILGGLAGGLILGDLIGGF